MEERVDKIEDDHREFKLLIHDLSKDFHTLTSNFTEVKDVLKTLSQATSDLALFRQEFQAHINLELVQNATRDKRIEKVEGNQSKVMWIVLTPIILAIVGLIIKGAVQ